MNDEINKHLWRVVGTHSLNNTANNEERAIYEMAFMKGAEIAGPLYERVGEANGIKMCVEALKSSEAHEFQREFGSFLNCPRWAIWLEKHFKEKNIL